MAEPYLLEIGTLAKLPDDAQHTNQSALTLAEQFPASGRRVSRLAWAYERPGGCGTLDATIQRSYDQRGGLDHFRDVILWVNGTVWWRGYVVSLQPKLTIPESIDLKAVGYARRAEEPTFTWRWGRQSLKAVGDTGEIAGVVQSIFALMPLLVGAAQGEPHPLADGVPVIDFPAYRPDALKYENQTPYEIFTSLAELAGNFDWGVDENRNFYFSAPQPLTDGTAMYSTVAGQGAWSADGSGGYYGDETYQDPQAVPPFLPIDDAAVFVVGGDLQEYTPQETVAATKTALIVYGTPPEPGDPTPTVTVSDPAGIDRWQRRIVARVSAPAFTAVGDLARWARQRLRMLSQPQLRGGLKAILHERLIHPLGAARVISAGTDLVERIQGVKYEMQQEGPLVVTVDLGYAPPPDRALAEQLRLDATLNMNVNAAQEPAFILRERHAWPRARFTAADAEQIVIAS